LRRSRGGMAGAWLWPRSFGRDGRFVLTQ
jgi:hypothetical protein